MNELRDKYLRALCESWMYADVFNNEEAVKNFFIGMTDEELVDELIEGFDIDDSIGKGDLCFAMSEVRKRVLK